MTHQLAADLLCAWSFARVAITQERHLMSEKTLRETEHFVEWVTSQLPGSTVVMMMLYASREFVGTHTDDQDAFKVWCAEAEQTIIKTMVTFEVIEPGDPSLMLIQTACAEPFIIGVN